MSELKELMGPHRYVVLAKDENGEVLLCPLMLDGSESIEEEAISRFRDVRCVLADEMRERAGRHAIGSRFDGKPTAEQEALTKRLVEQGV